MIERDTRFDNISTADLVEREKLTRLEAQALKTAVRDRLVKECTIQIGKVYRVAEGRFAGRSIWVEGVNAGIPDTAMRGDFYVFAWGRLNNKKSLAGDGWGIKRQNINVDRLVLVGDP